MTQKFKVHIRRGDGWEVKRNAEEIDGQIYEFIHGWLISNEDSKIYAGETAWIPQDHNYPRNAPIWIASGDLESI